MNKFHKILAALTVALTIFFVSACESDSDVVSENLSKDADNYKVYRQIVVYNAISDKYVLEVQGYCALGNDDKADRITYTCKTEDGYVKDIIGKSDNTIVYAHQMYPKNVSSKHYKVVLKPSTIVPDFELR